MSTADSSQTRVAFIEESTYGTTPATPAFQVVRMTSEGLKHTRTNTSSNEIRSDRNAPDLVQTSGAAEGQIAFELSYETFDEFLESFMYNDFSSDVLKNGVTQKSFTIEKKFETGATDAFLRYTGMIASTFSLNIQAQEMVTGSFGFQGKGGSTDNAIITGATYTSPTTGDVFNAGINFGSLSMTGVTSPKVTAISIEGTNNLRQQPVIGSIESIGVGAGQFGVNGSVTCYFENTEAYQLFLDGTDADLEFVLTDNDDNSYTFTLPRIKFSDADVVAGANNEDVLITLPFQALYDSSEACTLKIERADAV